MTHRYQRSDPATWTVAPGYATTGVDMAGNFAVRNGTGAAVMPQKLYARRHTLAFGDLSEFSSPKGNVAMGAALPADAVVAQVTARIVTPFSDGDSGDLQVHVVMYDDVTEVNTITGWPADLTDGAGTYQLPVRADDLFQVAGLSPTLGLDTGGVDLDTFTAGEAEFTVFFYRAGEVSNG